MPHNSPDPIIAVGTPYIICPHCARKTIGAFECGNPECPTNGTQYEQAVRNLIDAAEDTSDTFPNLWRLRGAVDRYREVMR